MKIYILDSSCFAQGYENRQLTDRIVTFILANLPDHIVFFNYREKYQDDLEFFECCLSEQTLVHKTTDRWLTQRRLAAMCGLCILVDNDLIYSNPLGISVLEGRYFLETELLYFNAFSSVAYGEHHCNLARCLKDL